MPIIRLTALILAAALCPTASGDSAPPTLTNHSENLALGKVAIADLVYYQDGKTLATVDFYGRIRVWSIPEKKLLWEKEHGDFVYSLACSSDDSFLASAGGDKRILLWEARTGKRLHEIRCADVVSGVAFSPKTRQLVSVSYDRKITFWDARTGAELRRISAGQLDRLTSVSYSPSDEVAVSGIRKASIQFGNGNVLEAVETTPVRLLAPDAKNLSEPLKIAGDRVRFSPDGLLLAATGLDVIRQPGSISGIDTIQLSDRAGFSLLTLRGRGWACEFSADGKYFVTAAGLGLQADNLGSIYGGNFKTDWKVTLWETATLAPIGAVYAEEDCAVVSFSPDGKYIAAGTLKGEILLIGVQPKLEKTTRELDTLWAELKSKDPKKGYFASSEFVAQGEKSVAFFARLLVPVSETDRKNASSLFDKLDHDDFGVRKAAQAELQPIAPHFRPMLRKSLHETKSAEVRSRLASLLEQTLREPNEKVLRELRAVSILERIGGTKAEALLFQLSQGTEGATLTVDAANATSRLRKGSKD